MDLAPLPPPGQLRRGELSPQETAQPPIYQDRQILSPGGRLQGPWPGKEMKLDRGCFLQGATGG